MVEGRRAGQHLVGQDPYGPDVYKVVVGLAFKDLRADIVEGAAVGISPFLAVDGPSEIAQFGNPLDKKSRYMRKDDVFRFDIPM